MNSSIIDMHKPAFRTVEAGRGLVWLQQGWAFFLRYPGPWMAIAVLLIVIYGLLSIVPVLGQIAGHLMAPLFAAGLLLGCRSLDNGGGLFVDHLFAGFRQNSSNLIMVGIFYLIGVAAAFFIALIVGGGLAVGGGLLGMGRGMMAAGMFTGALLFMLVFVLLSVPLLMAFWFAPALVLFKDAAPLPAMILSFRACLKNTLSFLVYGVLACVLMVLAAIPLGLGFVVLIPVFIGSFYWSYVDIFE